MGFFSWKTQDTKKSIWNRHYTKKTFKVVMTDHKNNQWIEEHYDGYGEFGGKDYYELIAEMNGWNTSNMAKFKFKKTNPFNNHELRDIGIALSYDNKTKKTIFPSLTENGKYYNGKAPKNCQYQGCW